MTVQIAQNILGYLNSHVVGKAEQNSVLVTSLIAGKNVFFVGAPGIGKSYSASLLAQCLDGKTKLTQFARDTREEELFGPLDLTKLMPKDGSQTRYVRVAADDGITYAQDADIFIMDEPANAPSGLLKRLHALLEERKVHTGEKWVDANLKIAVGTSNEMLPEDCYALNDRFTVRYECKDLGASDQFRFIKAKAEGSLRKPSAEGAPKITPEQLAELRISCEGMMFSKEAYETIENLIAALEAAHIKVSTRNWENTVPCLQAFALLQGADEVKAHHVGFAKHILWRDLSDRRKIWDIIDEIVPNPMAQFEATCELVKSSFNKVSWVAVNRGMELHNLNLSTADTEAFINALKVGYEFLKFAVATVEKSIGEGIEDFAPSALMDMKDCANQAYICLKNGSPESQHGKLDALMNNM